MKWSDEYWPLLIQLYKNKPEGVKPLYSKGLVDISLLLHIAPKELHRKMQELRKLDTPYLKYLWAELADNQRKLNKAVNTFKKRQGLGNAEAFFDGVETKESFERDFRPIEEEKRLTHVHLIIILNLYFQLTPTTMVNGTEEVQELAKFLKLPASLIVEVMEVFQLCDPYLKGREDMKDHTLLSHCKEIWNRYGNDDTEKLSAVAAQMREYFK